MTDLFTDPNMPIYLGVAVGVLLVVLIVLERRYHGLANLFKKKK